MRSENLYQLTAYLMNAHTREGANADGMLIFPKVDQELYEMSTRFWQAIDKEIRALVA